MKKIAYLMYVSVIITLLVCVKVNVISYSIGTGIFFVLGMVELLFCFGSYYPTQTQHIETLQTMQDKLDSRNDPIHYKTMFVSYYSNYYSNIHPTIFTYIVCVLV